MTEYALYLESGPRQKTTMVHVPDLLGCMVSGPTTPDALTATPEAIRTFLRFLKRHGAPVKPDAPFTTRVAAHVMEGSWIGYGDPAPGFEPDFAPLSSQDLHAFIERLKWLQADLLKLVRPMTLKQVIAEPAKGRTVHAILMHVANAHAGYLRYGVGKVDGLTDAVHDVERNPDDLPAALSRVWQITNTRVEAMTKKEREQIVPHGQMTWTARRMMRRMLEHSWEHLQELSDRVGKARPAKSAPGRAGDGSAPT